MTIAAGTTEQLFEGLTPGTTYTFSVVATNSIGDSVSSSVVSAYTSATVPGTPASLNQGQGYNTINLIWTAPATNGGSPILYYVLR
jgi:hypothetical protein